STAGTGLRTLLPPPPRSTAPSPELPSPAPPSAAPLQPGVRHLHRSCPAPHRHLLHRSGAGDTHAGGAPRLVWSGTGWSGTVAPLRKQTGVKLPGTELPSVTKTGWSGLAPAGLAP
ncbi:hypothetical protein Agub_g15965, partial [Astrephomene gubernaculifera]